MVQKVRETARRERCAHNLMHVGRADLRHEQFHGHLVPARLGPDSTASLEVRHLRTAVERSGASGFTLMLPFVERIPLKRRNDLVRRLDVYGNNSIWPATIAVFDPREDWRTPERLKVIGRRRRAFVCPSSGDQPQTTIEHFQTWDRIPTTGSYAFVAGHRGVHFPAPVQACLIKHHNTGPHLYWTTYSIEEIEDGASNTISVGEVIDSHTPNSSNIWTYTLRHLDCFRTTGVPLNTLPGVNAVYVGSSSALVNGAFASRHPKGAYFVYCDGHVKFMKDTVDFNLYQNLSTIAGDPALRDEIDESFCRENRF
jgi:prepilin-type processing-associated H-X9-DG protein